MRSPHAASAPTSESCSRWSSCHRERSPPGHLPRKTAPTGCRHHTSRRHAMLTALAPARTLDAAAIRDDFPLLARSTPDERPLVYLDSAASSQKPAAVIAALDHYYRYLNANVHRGVYRLSEAATEKYEAAR